MKIVVLSDLHGREDRARQVLRLHADADAVFFLGDGIRSLPYALCTEGGRLFAGVRGNCDSLLWGGEYSYSQELFLNLGEYTVMMMHGHTHGVKSGVERAARYAAARGADLLLYGHTHLPEEHYLGAGTDLDGWTLEKPLWIMNPGSLGEPRAGKPSYGLIQIQKGQLLLSHGTV